MVEDVMMSILNKLAISGHINNLPAYVYRSTHNKIVDYLRTDRKTMSLQQYMDEEGEFSLLDILSEGGSNVSDDVEKKEFMDRLAKSISQLEPRQRAVFVATEFKGISFKELSEQWNEPVGTLLSRKCRAVKALQEMLKDLKPDSRKEI
jgi:RNA polymerase sigma factor (sigma-70 family)